MHERCPLCHLKFEREQGYFLGAMYISYGLALLAIAIFALLVWLTTRRPMEKLALPAILLFLPLVPSITLFSRVLWVYFDQAIDPTGD
jgi:hypothetical protein